MNGSSDSRVGAVAITRGAVGVALVFAAPGLGDRATAPSLRRRVVWATRLLAARHLIEASALGVVGSARLRRGIAIVDLAHGASMVLLALRSPALRSSGVAAAAEAFSLAAVTYPHASLPRRFRR